MQQRLPIAVQTCDQLQRPLWTGWPSFSWAHAIAIATLVVTTVTAISALAAVSSSPAPATEPVEQEGSYAPPDRQSDTYSYYWSYECAECEYDCSRCDDGGPSEQSCNTGCSCPGTHSRTGAQLCNCPFDDNCNVNPCCYNPRGGSIPGGCKHGCTFG